MKKFITIISSIITLILVWACSDYEHTNPFHPDSGDITPLQTLTLEVQKVDHIQVIWDSDYLNEEDGYKFQVDRKVGNEDWVEKYKLFNSDVYTFVDSSAGIDQANYYRVSVAFDDHLSASVSDSVFNTFYPPSNINLNKIDLKTVQVRWSDNSNGEDGFVIDRYSNGDWFDNFAFVDENIESWIDSTLTLNDSIRYRISAYRNDTRSTAPASQWMDTKIPAPGNFKHEFVDISTIKLSWIDNSNGEDGFKIERKIAIDSWQPLVTIPADSTNFIDATAPVGDIMQYRISTFFGPFNSELVETPMFENIFPAPSNLVLNQMDLNTIRLDWTDNSIGEDGFYIDKRDSLGNWQTNVVDLGPNIETWTDTPTDIYDSLAYRVKAYKGGFLTAYSEATMNDINFPPPSDLIVTRVSLYQLKLEWTDNSVGEDNFIIDRKIDDNAWEIGFGVVPADSVSWVTGADLGSTCQYRVYAKAGSNYSNYLLSDAIFLTLEAPTDLSFTKLDLNSIRLNWTDNCDWEEGFMIDKFIDGSWNLNYGYVFENVTQWIDDSADINKDIVYRVKAYDYDEIVYYYSDAIETGVIDNTFPAPSDLTADVSGMNITLNWTDNSTGEVGFKIDRKYNGDPWDLDYAQVSSDVVTWNETVADTGKYYYRVKGYLGTDESAVSDVTDGWVNTITFIRTFGGIEYNIGKSVHQTPDGGYIITGKKAYDLWLIKIDLYGDESWSKTFGGDRVDEGYDVNLTSDGGYIVTGSKDMGGTIGYELWLIRTDSNGNEIWDKTFSGLNANGSNTDVGFSASETTDGGFIVAGETIVGAEGREIFLIRTDQNGNELWRNTFGESVGDDKGFCVQQTSDSGFIISGYTSEYDGQGGLIDEQIYLVKVNSNGDEIWSKQYGGTSNERASFVIETTDGGFAIIGYTGSFGNGSTDVWLVKTDTSGNLQWDKTFGGISQDYGSCLEQTDDGGYIITGNTESFGNSVQVYVIKTDSYGYENWSKQYGTTTPERSYQVEQTYDKGYIIVGEVWVADSSQYDLYLIKTNALGNVEGEK